MFAGRTAVVTGASRGLGQAIATAFAAQRAKVAFFGRDVAALEALRETPDFAAQDTEVFRCDANDEVSVGSAIAAANRRFGRIDYLVHAAGGTAGIGARGVDLALVDFDALIGANLRGLFLLIRAAAPEMARAGGGRIVAISGTYGLRGREGRTGYSAAKFGQRGLVRSFARELGPSGITVNAVCPGMVEGAAFEAAAKARGRDAVLADHPLGRVARPEDVAAAVLFLCGPGGGAITGQDIVVDCGATA